MKEQYIFRRVHRANYTTIDNEMFDTGKLSLGAIGLACVILSKPNNWKVKIEYFASICIEGEKAIRSLLKELATAGYMMRVRERDADGTLRTITLVSDYPKFIEVGTPEQRIQGYAFEEGQPTPPLTEPRSTDMSVTGSSVQRHGGRGEVIVNTDEVNTELVNTNNKTKNDDDDNARARKSDAAIFKAWAENIPGTMTPILSEKLHDLADECGAPAVIHGIVASVEAGARNFNYIAACARNHAAGVEPAQRGKGRDAPPKKQTGLDAHKDYMRRKGILV